MTPLDLMNKLDPVAPEDAQPAETSEDRSTPSWANVRTL